MGRSEKERGGEITEVTKRIPVTGAAINEKCAVMENRMRSFIKKLNGSGFRATQKEKRSKDPVCGMRVSGDLFKADDQGKSYFFCSAHCRDRFVANPGNYAN